VEQPFLLSFGIFYDQQNTNTWMSWIEAESQSVELFYASPDL
jgi:hypothetical protein